MTASEITIPGMFLTGTHAARPTASVGKGTLYACSTHGKVYQTLDGGGTWSDWYTAAGAVAGVYQPLDAELTAIAGLTSAANKGITFTGSGAAAVYDLTAFALTLLDDANAAAMATTLGLGTGDSPQHAALNIGHATDTTLDRASAGVLQVEGNRIFAVGGADVPVADGGTGASTAAGARTNLGLVIGTDVKAQAPTIISPTQLAANTDNWNPTSLATADIIRASTDASRNLTGIVAPAGQQTVILENIGAFDLVLKHDVTSTAANRFYCPNDTDVTLQKDSAIVLVYDTTSTRWRVIGGTGSGSGSALSVSEVDGSPVDAATTGLVFPNDSVVFAGHVATIRQVPYGFIGAKAYSGSAQTVNSTTAVITMTAEEFDSDAFHSTSVNTSRMTIPAGLGGKYLIQAGCYASGASAYFQIWKNGAAVRTGSGPFSSYGGTLTTVLDLVAGDYIELAAITTGNITIGHASALDAQTFLAVTKLDAGRVGSGIGAKATTGGTQAITTTYTVLPFSGTDAFDTDAFHDPASNNSRLTVPTGLGGKYLVVADGVSDSNNSHAGYFRVNGSTAHGYISGAPNTVVFNGSTIIDLAAGDYVEVLVKVNTGTATIQNDGRFSLVRIDSGGSTPVTSQPGYEFDYVASTTGDTAVTATTEAGATTIVTGSAVTYDGATVVMIEFYAPQCLTPATNDTSLAFALYDGAASIGIFALANPPAGTKSLYLPIRVTRRLTPSNASHTYSVRAWGGANTGHVYAGAGGVGVLVPAFIRITRV